METWLVVFQVTLEEPKPKGFTMKCGLRFKKEAPIELVQAFTKVVHGLCDLVEPTIKPKEESDSHAKS